MAISRLGFIGDVHAEHVRLERALDHLAARGVDVVACAGDVTDGSGSVDRCCELLRQRGVVTVRGNHDRWFVAGSARELPEATPLGSLGVEAERTLATLPPCVELETALGRALLCHGLGTNDMARVLADDFGYALATNDDLQRILASRYYRFVLNGHSHRRMVRHFEGVTIVNAGTLKHDHDPGFLEIDFGTGRVLTFSFDEGGSPRPDFETCSLLV